MTLQRVEAFKYTENTRVFSLHSALLFIHIPTVVFSLPPLSLLIHIPRVAIEHTRVKQVHTLALLVAQKNM